MPRAYAGLGRPCAFSARALRDIGRAEGHSATIPRTLAGHHPVRSARAFGSPILYRRPSINERILPGPSHRLKVDTAP